MWNLHQMVLAEYHQRDMQEQANRWRLINRKEDYQPNRSIRSIRRKRKN